MALLQYDTGGKEYDGTTAAQYWTGDMSLATFTSDGVLGYYVAMTSSAADGEINRLGKAIPDTTTTFVQFRARKRAFSSDFFIAYIGPGIALGYNETTQRFSLTGGVIHSDPIANIINVVNYYKIRYTASNAGAGVFQFYVNDVLVIDVNSQTIGTSNIVQNIQFAGGLDICDLIIMDDTTDPNNAAMDNFLGDTILGVRFPDGDIGTPQWTNDFGGDNYAQVNSRVAPGNSHFLHSGTVDDEDIYSLPATPSDTVTVYAQIVEYQLQKTAGGGRTIAPILSDGTHSDFQGDDITPASGTFARYTQYYTYNPLVSAPWTKTTADSLRIGQKVTA